MGSTISAISLADDTALVSNNIIKLKLLLYLTMQYCSKYCVDLVPDKTKLLAFSISGNDPKVQYAKLTADLSLYGKKIPFSEEAEHLGVLRSAFLGNTNNILERLKAHNHNFTRFFLLALPTIIMLTLLPVSELSNNAHIQCSCPDYPPCICERQKS